MALVGSQTISDLLPDAEELLELEPEELAGYLLEHLNSFPETYSFSRTNYGHSGPVKNYPPQLQRQVSQALMEAWSWLEREGLLVPRIEQVGTSDQCTISRRGRHLKKA